VALPPQAGPDSGTLAPAKVDLSVPQTLILVDRRVFGAIGCQTAAIMMVRLSLVLSTASFRRLAAAAFAVALVAGAGTIAHADPARKAADFTVRVDQASSPAGGTSLTWDARKGRWGMTVNVESPRTREPDWTDVKAGAYYRVSPSLQIGGAVSMGDAATQPEAFRKVAPQQPAPRVRLETAFKF